MTGFTVNHSLPFPEGQDPVVVHTDVEKLAVKTDSILAKHATDIENARYWDGDRPLAASSLDDIPPNRIHTIWHGDQAEALGLPRSQGTIIVHRWGESGGAAMFQTRGLNPEIWITSKLSGGWVPWVEVGATPAGGVAAPPPTSASPSGYKTIPLALTLGNGGASRAAAEGTVRIPLHFAAPITRWRLHISDGNPRFGLTKATQWTLRGMAVGAYDGTMVTGRQDVVDSPITTTPGSSKIVTPWTTAPLSGRPSVLQFAYSNASERPIALAGACWTSTVISAWQRLNNDGFTHSTTCPFDIWIEAETPAGTPVVAVVGDSNGAGVGTTMPVHDSWLSQWARAHDALPVHYAHSGDSLANQGDATAAKWTRWSHLARPDMAIIATGSNDLAGAPGLAEMQKRFAEVAAVAAELLSPIIHAVTIKPRNGEPAGSPYDAGRKAYNQWLSTVPDPARAVHDFVTPVSADDQVMDEGMHATDGTHMTTAGHAALAAALPASITPGPLLYASDVPPS